MKEGPSLTQKISNLTRTEHCSFSCALTQNSVHFNYTATPTLWGGGDPQPTHMGNPRRGQASRDKTSIPRRTSRPLPSMETLWPATTSLGMPLWQLSFHLRPCFCQLKKQVIPSLAQQKQTAAGDVALSPLRAQQPPAGSKGGSRCGLWPPQLFPAEE